MPRDYIEELALIEMSKLQRETLARWVTVLLAAGERDLAEEIDNEPRCDCGHLFEICGAPHKCW